MHPQGKTKSLRTWMTCKQEGLTWLSSPDYEETMAWTLAPKKKVPGPYLDKPPPSECPGCWIRLTDPTLLCKQQSHWYNLFLIQYHKQVSKTQARLIPQHVRPIFRRKSPAVTHAEGRPCHHPLPWVPYLMPSHGQIGAQAQSKWLSRNGGEAERSDSRGIA